MAASIVGLIGGTASARSRRRWAGLIVALLLLTLVAVRVVLPLTRPDDFSFGSPGPYLVMRVVDGDTLLLRGGTRVRLIGVDTPESVHPRTPAEPLSREAAEFTRRHVAGQFVRLQFDRERRDRYHRVLAYVWVDGACLNEELILAGYSRAETGFPYSAAMKRRFLAAESQARQAERGIWAAAP